MFTLNQSYEEILSEEPVGRAVGNLFPSCWMQRITPPHAQDAMCYIAETVRLNQEFLSRRKGLWKVPIF